MGLVHLMLHSHPVKPGLSLYLLLYKLDEVRFTNTGHFSTEGPECVKASGVNTLIYLPSAPTVEKRWACSEESSPPTLGCVMNLFLCEGNQLKPATAAPFWLNTIHLMTVKHIYFLHSFALMYREAAICLVVDLWWLPWHTYIYTYIFMLSKLIVYGIKW